MESLAALGLVSSIVQLVDFASKLAASTITLYKSARQAGADSLVLRDVVDDLIRLSDAVIVPNDPGDASLKQLALSAKDVAGNLLAVLDDLQVKGKKTAWKSFLLAAKEVRNRDTVTSITKSIAIIQTQITMRVGFQIKESIERLENDIRNLQTTNDRLHLNNTSELERLRTDLLNAFDTIKLSCRRRRNNKTKRRDEEDPIDDLGTISKSLPSYHKKISALSRNVDSITDAQHIAESFYFENLTTREFKIHPAHAKTFEWAFHDVLPDKSSRVGFRGWLRTGNGIFWIRGKAGSGKSTLMKFISNHPTTLDHLKHWSGPLQLVMGSFYFWNSGTDLQKSQEGLLRSLIFEILRQCPELALHVQKTLLLCTEQKSSSMTGFNESNSSASLDKVRNILARIRNEGWSFCQLTEILKGLLRYDQSRKFCFIIDGLDEFKSQHTQDQQVLVDNLKWLATSPNIKLCVSSRPLTVFLDAFNGGVSQCLKLEDLTKDDIRSYALDKLSGHNQFLKLTQIDPGYSTLVNEVVTKSQGVFLWVFLVVRELLDGLTFNDTIGIMRQRLESFPATLEDFFQHMLDLVDKIYLSQTIQLFQLSASATEPLPMLYYSVLGDIEQDPGFTWKPQRPFCESEYLQRLDVMRRKLDARSKGLLETVEPEGGIAKVDFLHRSVRDFVMSGAIDAFSEQQNYERQCTWLLFCTSIVVCYRRSSLHGLNFVGNPANINDKLACFVKKARDDGANLHTIHKTMLDAWGVACTSEIDPGATVMFVLAACACGLTDYISSELLADEDSICNAVAGATNIFSAKIHGPDLIHCLISCAETRGLPSKKLLCPVFESFKQSMRLEPHDAMMRYYNVALDIVKAIASTGYKLNQNFVSAYFPNDYAEVIHINRTSRRNRTTMSTQLYFWFKRKTDVWYARWRPELWALGEGY